MTERLRDGRYELIGELGAGGMGVVREAIDHELDRRVALKSVRELTPDRLLRFKHEFRVARDLHHPNLVRLGELFEDRGEWYFTMELVRGVDLLSHVRGLDPGDAIVTDDTTHTLQLRRPSSASDVAPEHAATGRCDVERLRAAVIQLARALDALHRAGLVHRDVKPGNVLVDGDGRVVLLDFGIATERTDGVDDADNDDGRVVGTAGYMAPEQVEGAAIGGAADWYAVGSILFAALTGRHPFTGRSRDVLEAKTRRDGPAPSSVVTGVPRELDRLCERLLLRDPALRPSAADLLAALGAEAEAAAPPTATFVGRDAVLGALDRAYAASRDAATVIVVEGDAGIGKTTLARQAVARWRDALVLRGRCHEREAIPYNALDGVVDELGRALARLPEEERDEIAGDDLEALAWLFPTLPAARASPFVDPVAARRRAFVALRVLLDRLAARSAVVIAIDDLHWADADSAAALDELLAPGAPRLLLLGTVRTASDRPWLPPPALAGATRIALGGLGAEEVAALAGAFGRADVDLTRLWRDTGGNPMLVEQWLSLPGGDGTPPPGALDAVVAARRARLSPAAAQVLEVVAVATREVPQVAVAIAAALDPDAFDAAIAELAATRFARIGGTRRGDPVEPVHDRVRDHVYAAIDPARRRVLHGRLAAALIAGGGAPEAIATQLVAAGETARASAFARAAAETAERALAFDRATGLYRVAIAGASTDDRAALHVRLGDALANAGRPDDAAAAYLAASDAAAPKLQLELRRRAAEQHLTGGYMDRGLAAIREILEETRGGRLPRTNAGAIASLIWARLRLAMRRLRWTRRDESELAPEVLTRLDAQWSVSMGLALTDSLRGAVFAMRLPLLCLPFGEELRIARALCAATVAHAGMALRRPAVRLLAAAERAADAHGSPLARFYAGMGRLCLEFLVDNDWRASVATTERLRALWRDAGRGRGWELDTVEQFGCFAELWLGRYRTIDERAQALARDAADAGNRYHEVGLRTYFASVAILLGDPDRGEADVADALSRWTSDRPDSNQAYWGLRSRTYAAIYRGDVEAAAVRLDPAWRQLRGSLLLKVPSVAAEAYAALGGYLVTRAALARASSERRTHLAAARKVSRRMRRTKMPGGVMAYVALEAGIAHVEGRADDTIALLRTAETAFAAAGMDALLAACRLRLGALVGGSEGDALEAAGLAWFTRERVPDPLRTSALLSPGWHPDA